MDLYKEDLCKVDLYKAYLIMYMHGQEDLYIEGLYKEGLYKEGLYK